MKSKNTSKKSKKQSFKSISYSKLSQFQSNQTLNISKTIIGTNSPKLIKRGVVKHYKSELNIRK